MPENLPTEEQSPHIRNRRDERVLQGMGVGFVRLCEAETTPPPDLLQTTTSTQGNDLTQDVPTRVKTYFAG